MFIPATCQETAGLGWDRLDVVLITGDAYIDSPFIGVAVIGKVLISAGYRVGIIAQPDIHTDKDIKRFGEPELFWGITGGSIDSLVANYTASQKKRKQDDFTPGGINNKRPDRAVIAYTNLVRRFFKNTKPIVIGGIEASLRRIAHYDFWSDQIRRSILLDAKADILVYGMGEKTILELSEQLKNKQNHENIKGISYISQTPRPDYLELPDFDLVSRDKSAFSKMFTIFYNNCDPITGKGLYQQYGNRYIIQNPPNTYLTQNELDAVYNLDFQRDLHPSHRKDGPVRALETIRFSITTHRGCYGECNFCAISIHQGRTVRWRSEESIVKEAVQLTMHHDFRGNILDVGGPTANMYGFECKKKITSGSCRDKRCLFPDTCQSLRPDHRKLIQLLRKIKKTNGIKNVFIASGPRYDLVLADRKWGTGYLEEIVRFHISGQLKIAPEHSENHILKLMGKPGHQSLTKFKDLFFRLSKLAGKNQFLTYYFIAAHPGCHERDMQSLREYASKKLKIHPEQIQIFTPTPSTYSTLMYYTQQNPFSHQKIFVEKNTERKMKQKKILI
ncbi:MAG: YgiQ family radical SAM protein [Desulfobacteraceae bacterium]|nr:MAG: YgiQ family radical SAM protein [Desulfobacteraceae bacterium]